MALDFIICKAINLHELSNLLWSSNLGAAKLLKSANKAAMKLWGPAPPGLAV